MTGSTSASALAWKTWFDMQMVCLIAKPSGQQGEGPGPLRYLRVGGTLHWNTHRVGRSHRLSGPMDFVSREVEKDVSIMKQIRKAREERHLAQKNKKEVT